jgi:hypothetical protein
MSKISFYHPQQSHSTSLLTTNHPSRPSHQKQPFSEKRIADPSSSIASEKRYPIPSFFEYRAKPREFDSL